MRVQQILFIIVYISQKVNISRKVIILTMNRKYFWISIIIRELLGITLAGISTICQLYYAQIAPPGQKGFYGTLYTLFVIAGHLVTNLLGVTHKWQPPIY